ncbi:hypothetical protein [Thalassobacillus hwangdonensis]|uniref:Uncharacterized protein n=1 Tax=Thalassobacillus hwangdonensis TaxID=546108 RepID=A0ABW3L4H7_9BACI
MKKRLSEADFLGYINIQNPTFNRQMVFGFLILFLWAFGVAPLYAAPFSPFFVDLGLYPAVLVTIMAVPYLFAPWKLEPYFYFLLGILSAVTGYCQLVVVVKYLYAWLLPESFLLLYVIFGSYVLEVIVMNLVNLKWLKDGTYRRYHENPESVNYKLIINFLIGCLVLCAIVFFLFYDTASYFMVIIVTLSFFQLILAYFTTFFHKGIVIRRHMDLTKKYWPGFGDTWQERKWRYED